MDELSNVSAFLKVVERGSLTSAAAALNCSASTVSKRLKQLEHSVGATLLLRSTHGNAKPTEAGEAYFNEVRTIIRGLENAKDMVRSVNSSLEGQLRVHMTPGTSSIVFPAIMTFVEAYPSLDVQVSVRPEWHDVLHRGFDVTIHSKERDADEVGYTSVEAREIVPVSHAICAAPSYLEKFGRPAVPGELVDHNCLVSIRQPSPHKWWFRRDGGKYAVPVRGRLEADNWITVGEAARAGLGIARVPYIGEGIDPALGLVPIFTDEVVSDRSIWAFMPRLNPVPRKVEALLSFLSEALRR